MKKKFSAIFALLFVILFAVNAQAQSLPKEFADCHIPQLFAVWSQNPTVGKIFDAKTFLKGENNGTKFETKLKKLSIKKNTAVYLLEFVKNGKTQNTFEVDLTFDTSNKTAIITKSEMVVSATGQRYTQTFNPNAYSSQQTYMRAWGQMLGFFTEAANNYIDVNAMLKN